MAIPEWLLRNEEKRTGLSFCPYCNSMTKTIRKYGWVLCENCKEEK